jgi:ABC-2 type transport system ATP-binding protein
VRIITTLLRFDAGHVTVAGYDVLRQAPAVRRRIGLVGQQTAVDEVLTGRQNLVLFGRLSHLGTRAARQRSDDLLAQFELVEAAHKPVATYSGGMRRRLDLAVSMLLAPPVLILDEPTTGLDPRSRSEVWDAVRTLVAGGTTVLLTTQYLEEADQLANQISVIDRGRVIAEGTPEQLKLRIGGDQIDITLPHGADLAPIAVLLDQVSGGPVAVDQEARRVTAPVKQRMTALSAVVRALDAQGVTPEDLSLRRPTLDDVFLQLTAPQGGAVVSNAAQDAARVDSYPAE